MSSKEIADELFEWKAFAVSNSTNPNFSAQVQSALTGGWELVTATFVPGQWEFLAKRPPA